MRLRLRRWASTDRASTTLSLLRPIFRPPQITFLRLAWRTSWLLAADIFGLAAVRSSLLASVRFKKVALQEYGLAAYQGGRHQGWGTENLIVPLEDTYLEIAAVFDEPVARACDWGRWEEEC